MPGDELAPAGARSGKVAGVNVRLYTIPGSHPGIAAQRMLAEKGIEYKRTDLMPVISKLAVRLLGFSGVTVPALKIDGRRVQGSIAIARELDRVQPEPPLVPRDEAMRTQVEQVERFADVGLQHPVRQILWWGLKRRRDALASYAEGARIGVPIGLAVRTGGPLVALSARFNEATDENVRDALAGLPGTLQRIDDWIEAGVLGGEHLNVGDLQVATSLRLAMTLDDLRDAIASRPAGRLAQRVVPEYPGHLPPVLPTAWLDPLRAA